MSLVRNLSGLCAAGLGVLAVVVAAAAVLGLRRDFPGPGMESVLAHVLAAVLALGLQVRADRDRISAGLVLILVLLISAVLLWTQWWN